MLIGKFGATSHHNPFLSRRINGEQRQNHLSKIQNYLRNFHRIHQDTSTMKREEEWDLPSTIIPYE